MPPENVQETRKTQTIMLLAGGAVSLLLPLLGVVYIRMSEAKTAHAPNSSVMFDRRENGEAKVNVSQTVTIVAPAATAASPNASSLDFVKGGANGAYFQDKPAAAPVAATKVPVPAPEPAPEAIVKKDGKKTFNAPKLKATSSFSSFKGGSPKPTGGQGVTGASGPPAALGDGGMADMLKNMPSGAADNPEIQKYLKNQGK